MEYLMLAKTYKGQDVTGWFWSEKLNGVRAFWDGGVGRGRENCSWGREKGRATGLWTRYGNIIWAPDWWLDKMPEWCCDGELYLGPDRLQDTLSIVKRKEPDERWRGIIYNVFDCPRWERFTETRWINNPNAQFGVSGSVVRPADLGFKCFEEFVEADLSWNSNLIYVPQHKVNVMSDVTTAFREAKESGREGIMVRCGGWEPKRSGRLLKIKDIDTDTGVVVGYSEGEGRLAGMMGAVVVRWGGKEFNVGGFTDEERAHRELFPIGSEIMFKFRGYTQNGVPNEARYARVVKK